jgi:tRNA(Ile)-lysidine synthase
MDAHPPLTPDDTAPLFAPLRDVRHALVAVSGGADSLALLLLLARSPEPPRLTVATVDHGLRPEAVEEAHAVARKAAALGLDHAILRWEGPYPTTGIQEAARAARYRLLVDHARRIGADALLTAHHADDQAETILMRLCSGSGLSGLAGMRSETETLGLRHLRPFLGVPKARLVATLDALGETFVDDPSNRNPAFARARWRAASAVLVEEGLDTPRLARFAARMARADAALSDEAERVFVASSQIMADHVDLSARLFAEPEEIMLRVLARAIGQVAPGAPPRLERLEAVLEALIVAKQRGVTVVRTLSHTVIRLGRSGAISITAENDPRPSRRAVDENERSA